jgi:SSS family solute:Na+ symporter
MQLGFIDYVAFVGFIGLVISISLWAGRKEKTTEDYFLAGRNLSWWLIGFSLIASNISTEHFIGMAGKGFGAVGLAIASWEWIAAVVLVFVAWFFLPKFLKAGIYTMPEYLGYRYSNVTRTIMAGLLLVAYIFVFLATVLFAGAVPLKEMFGLDTTTAIWIIGILAGAYTIYGGLKAVVWSDLIQGAALLIGGAMVLFLSIELVGGWEVFFQANGDKLHVLLPETDPELPWIAVVFGGMWIPNIFYWGLNQFITQRTLGAKSLKEGQRGIFFAAFIKLLIPFIIVFPGIIAFQLFAGEISSANAAYPVLITKVLPIGLRGVMLAALFGAVMSSLDSGLDSASTIFTMDFYKQFINKDVSPEKAVKVGRISTGVFMIFGCIWAPIVGGFESLFDYIQMFWGFITPGIVAAFIVGMLIKKAPAFAANTAMLMGIPMYGALLYFFPQISFVHHMMFIFTLQVITMGIMTIIKPMEEERVMPTQNKIDLKTSPDSWLWGSLIIAATVGLYIVFA